MYIPERKPNLDLIVDNALEKVIPVVEQAGGIDLLKKPRLSGRGVLLLNVF